MSRPLRIEFPGAYYHVTSRGDGREDIFLDDVDRERFLEGLSQVVERFNWACHAYCLMDNHYHLLIQTFDANLGLGMRQLNGVYTQRFNRRHRRVGHVFQGRYKAILVQRGAYLLELCRYIVLNPVRAQIVTSAENWRWSSYRQTVGLSPSTAWCAVNSLLAAFSTDKLAAISAYRRFVTQGVSKESPWLELKSQIFLGDDSFVEKMQRQIVGGAHLDEVPARQKSRPPKSLDWYADQGNTRNKAMTLAYRGGGYSMKAIGDHFGLHYSSVSKIIKREENS